MTPFTYKNKKLHIEDVALEKIAAAAGTPVYCYSASAIEENYLSYLNAFCRVLPPQDFTICYATKANSNVAVLKLLKTLGAGADIVSGGELLRARKAGIPPAKIVYSGVGKSAEELETAIRAGLMQINVESSDELRLISKIAGKLRKTVHVAIRINPNVDAKAHAKTTTGKKENKFGIDIDLAPAAYKLAASLPHIKADGVAVHIGSQITQISPYTRAYKCVADLVRLLRRQGHDINRVDIGGGIGIVYREEKLPSLDAYADMVAKIIAPLDVHIIMEPGRSIVGNAGVLLTKVVQVKKGTAKTFVILDAAMNDLIRPTLYDAYHAILPCRDKGSKKIVCDIVGPVCETGDTFLTNHAIAPMAAGDLAAIMSAGAYGAVMSSTYNTRPLVAEVLVRGNRFSIIRKAIPPEEIVGRDIVPAWV